MTKEGLESGRLVRLARDVTWSHVLRNKSVIAAREKAAYIQLIIRNDRDRRGTIVPVTPR
jgi:hypothetical protein